MAVYIRLNDAVAAFKQAEANDKEDFVKYGIFDDGWANFFPAERAIDIISGLNGYIKKEKNCFTTLRCPPEYTHCCNHLLDGIDCEDCWQQ